MTNKYVFSKIALAVLCMVMVQVLDLLFYFIDCSGNILQTAATLALCGYAVVNVVKAFGVKQPKLSPVIVLKIRKARSEKMAA